MITEQLRVLEDTQCPPGVGFTAEAGRTERGAHVTREDARERMHERASRGPGEVRQDRCWDAEAGFGETAGGGRRRAVT